MIGCVKLCLTDVALLLSGSELGFSYYCSGLRVHNLFRIVVVILILY